jgi:hypothetical protein
MARRGYLQRIAAPLIPGEPVLFPVPGPSLEDARPVAPARRPAAIAPAGPAAIVRRKQAARAKMAAAQEPIQPAGKAAPRGESTAPAPAEPGQTKAHHADSPEDWAVWPARAGAMPQPAAEPMNVPAAQAPNAEAPRAEAPRGETLRPAFDGNSAVPSGVPDAGATVNPPERAAPATTWSAEDLPAPAAQRRALSLPPEDPASAPDWPAGPGSAAPWSAATHAAPPRIHIGTIEIRTTTPPPAAVPPPPAPTVPPATAPRAAAPSPQRGYAWRFGLIQG